MAWSAPPFLSSLLLIAALATLSTLSTHTHAAGFPEVEGRFYVGVVATVPPVGFGHDTPSSDGNYLGLSEVPGGPYNTLASPVLLEQMTYEFVIENAPSFYLTTSTVGGGSATAPLNPSSPNATVTGGSWMGNAHVGMTGDTLRVTIAPSVAPAVFYYQSAVQTSQGYAIKLAPCVSTAPSAPVLTAPLASATGFVIGNPLTWLPVDFGRRCPLDALQGGVSAADVAAGRYPQYRIVFQLGAGPIPVSANETAVPPQGQRDVIAPATSYPLSSLSVEPGRTYSWGVIAMNGVRSMYSGSRSFTTQVVTTPFNGTTLVNGALLQDRIYPDVPASFSKYKYYSVPVSSPGGTLLIVATASSLQVVGAPSQGAINLFATAYNMTHPGETIRRPTSTAGRFTYRSEEDVAVTDRRSVRIPVADAPRYYIGVEAAGGSATFAISALYQCPVDSVQVSLSSTSCVSCPVNMEAVFPGAVVATGATGANAAAGSCRCVPGFFGPVGGPCVRCPRGGVCDGSSAPAATRGWWAAPEDRSFFFACPVLASCLGGPDSRCREGYTGRLCANCDRDWYKLNGQCYKCPAAPGFTFFMGMAILFLFLVLCVELARWYRKISSVAVTINFIQTVAVLPLYQLKWPQYIKVFFNDLSGFNLNPQLTAPECSFPGMTWSQLWVFTMFFPVLVAALMSVVYVVVWLIRQFQLSKSVERPIKTSRAWDVIVPTYVTFIVFFYVSIAQTTVSFYDCTEQDDNTFTLDASADILCYSSEWFALLPLAVMGFLGYVIGIPFALMSWLYLRRHRLYDVSPKGQKVYRWLGPLYLRFHVHLYWWEWIIFARKFGLIVTGAFLTTFTLFQSLTAIFILVLSLWIHLLVYPYAYNRSNWLEALFTTALIVLFLMGILFQSNTLPDASGMPQFVFGVAVSLFTLCLGAAVYCVARELRDVYRPISEDDLLMMQRQLGKHELEHITSAEVEADEIAHARAAPTMMPEDFSSEDFS